jgi:hypothetical protein
VAHDDVELAVQGEPHHTVRACVRNDVHTASSRAVPDGETVGGPGCGGSCIHTSYLAA